MGMPISYALDIAKFRRLEIRSIRNVNEIFNDGDRWTVEFGSGKAWTFVTSRLDIFFFCFEIMMLTSAVPGNFFYSNKFGKKEVEYFEKDRPIR